MSKESAMQALTGQPAPAVNPPLIGTPPPGETAKETKIVQVDPAKPQSLDSDRFAALAKKEAKLQQEREIAKRELAEAQKAKLEAESILKQKQDFDALRGKDPIQALKNLGFNDAELFNFLAAAEKKEPTAADLAAQAAQAEIAKYKEEEASKAKQAEQERNTNVINKFKNNIKETLKAEAEKLEYCNFYGPMAEDLIYETTVAVLKAEGKVIPVSEAAEMVEKYYEEQDVAMQALKKRGRVEAPPAPAPTLKAPAPAPPKTLTNRAGPTGAALEPKGETREQKRARLENMLRNGS